MQYSHQEWMQKKEGFSPPLDGACTQITLFVVPKSIPATVDRPRNPILAMIPTTSTTTPIAEGINASIPPDFESFWCLAVMLDFFFLLTIRLEDGPVSDMDDACLDHSFCRSLLHLRFNIASGDDTHEDVVPLVRGWVVLSDDDEEWALRVVEFAVSPLFFSLGSLDDLHMPKSCCRSSLLWSWEGSEKWDRNAREFGADVHCVRFVKYSTVSRLLHIILYRTIP